MAETYKVKFKPPSTYTPPDDKQEGETFDATVKLRVEEDGRLCVLTLDGVPMTEEEDTEEVEVEEKTSEPQSMAEAAQMHRQAGYQL